MTVSVGIVDIATARNRDLLLAEVSTDEKAAFLALRDNRHARQYLASRWLLRRHLAAERGGPATDFAVDYPAGLAPRLLGSSVQLGLSHSDTLCMSVVSTDVAVGCDVERIKPRRQASTKIAALYFADDEASTLAEAPPDSQWPAFYRLWTLKEAGLKALGLGISHRLDSVVFAAGPAWRCIHPPGAGQWRFAARELTTDSGRFALALAAREPMTTMTAWQFEPGSDSARAMADGWDLIESG